MNAPVILPKDALTRHLAALQRSVRILQPARSAGVLTRQTVSGVQRTPMPTAAKRGSGLAEENLPRWL